MHKDAEKDSSEAGQETPPIVLSLETALALRIAAINVRETRTSLTEVDSMNPELVLLWARKFAEAANRFNRIAHEAQQELGFCDC